jgi:hopene-associated glycosyltransferase HpnB
MQQGLRHAGVLGDDEDSPAFVLFTDADIAHAPSSLRTLVREAVGGGLDLDSRMALLRCESHAERMLIPAFLFFFAAMYPMRRVADPQHETAASAGGCQLVRAATMRAMRGVESIAGRRIDDVSLAREMKWRGARLSLACSTTLVKSLREYPRLADVWRMVRRSAFEELRFSWARLAACLLALALVFVAPLAALVAGPIEARIAGAVAWALSAVAYAPAVAHFGLRPWRALTLPVAGVLYAAMTVDSALRHATKRENAWRAPGA